MKLANASLAPSGILLFPSLLPEIHFLKIQKPIPARLMFWDPYALTTEFT